MSVYTHTDYHCLKNKNFAIVGYGSQGRAQAMNLRDSGLKNITIVLYKGSKSLDVAINDGFTVDTSGESVEKANIVVMLAPEEEHEKICNETLSSFWQVGQTVIFAHGFSVLYGLVRLPEFINVCLVSPKSVGPELRNRYKKNESIVCFVSVAHDNSGNARDIADAYAAAVMSGRLIIETTFKEETEANLFSEQVVLCGGIPALIKSAFEVMVGNGISPELAYIGCLHEVKLITDLMYSQGIYGLLSNISSTAEYGASCVEKRIIGDGAKLEMNEVLSEIRNGNFFQKLTKELDRKALEERRESLKRTSIEVVGEKLRGIMKEGTQEND